MWLTVQIAEACLAAIGLLVVVWVGWHLPAWWRDERAAELEAPGPVDGPAAEQPSGPVAAPPNDPPLTLFAGPARELARGSPSLGLRARSSGAARARPAVPSSRSRNSPRT